MSVPVSQAVVAAPPVPMSGPYITDAEIAAVTAVLRSGTLSIGPYIKEFEHRIARLVGGEHAIGVSSGTAGLHLAMISAGVDEGDIVVTTPFSFVASANCILYERGIPVFVDVDPWTGNINPSLVAEAIRDLGAGGPAAQRWLPPTLRADGRRVRSVKAILPVHALGLPADIDPIMETARASGIPVVEDACEALGATYKGRAAGSIGDIGVFAFYPNKQLTTGEGGMMVTNRGDWAARARSLRNQGRDNMDAWLRHDRLGYNYRMNELSAALGVAQCRRIQELLGARDRVAAWYGERLAGLHGVAVPTLPAHTTRASWFAYVIRLEEYIDRDAVMKGLAERGIPSRTYFSPIHLQPFYVERFGYRPGEFPVAEALGRCWLALPFSGTLTEEQVDRVCHALSGLVATV